MKLRRVGAWVVLGLLWPATLRAEVRPLALDDALGQLGFGIRIPIDVSPDGRWVAYTLEDARRRESTGETRYFYYSRTGAPVEALGCDVWLTETEMGQTQNLTGGKGTSWGAVWSPDGRALAFCSDRDGVARLWLWEKATGKMRRVSDVIVRPFFGFELPRWSADGNQILMKVLPEDLTLEAAADLIHGPPPPPARGKQHATVSVYRSPADQRPAVASPAGGKPSWMNRYLTDLALVDVRTGAVRRLARRRGVVGFWLSPDGTRAAYTAIVDRRDSTTQQPYYDLWVAPAAGGEPRTVAERQPLTYGITVSWSPDGKRLAYTTAGPRAGGDCYLVESGSEPVRLTKGKHPNFGDDHRAPLWSADGQAVYCVGEDNIWRIGVGEGKLTQITHGLGRKLVEVVGAGPGRFWSPDGARSMIVAGRDDDTKRVSFHRVDLESGRAECVWEGDHHFGWELTFACRGTPDGKRLIFPVQDARHPPDLWVTDAGFRRPRRLTHINPHLERYTFGASRLVRWRSIDGEPLRGALLLPTGYQEGKRYPLVVKVYGGALDSNSVNRFGLSGRGVDNLQMFATRGYAVLTPDAPLKAGSPMHDLVKTVLPGVDRVVEMGAADPDRLGVTGHSYGGYSTLALLAQTTRFKAAMMSAGVGDLLSMYGHMGKDGDAFSIGWSEEGQGRMGGHPWQYFQRYVENSPVFYLDRVTTPLLIVHGALDDTVPPAQAEEVFVGLRRLGKEVVYARYEGEEHWQGTWGHANVVDYWERVLDWFDRHIGAKAGGK